MAKTRKIKKPKVVKKKKIVKTAKVAKPKDSEGKEIGRVSSYFSHVEVAAIKLSKGLKVGDTVHIKGNTTDFETSVDGIQIERESVEKAKKGNHIGIKVPEKVRPNDAVYLVE